VKRRAKIPAPEQGGDRDSSYTFPAHFFGGAMGWSRVADQRCWPALHMKPLTAIEWMFLESILVKSRKIVKKQFFIA
jgi:hypothetical protein